MWSRILTRKNTWDSSSKRNAFQTIAIYYIYRCYSSWIWIFYNYQNSKKKKKITVMNKFIIQARPHLRRISVDSTLSWETNQYHGWKTPNLSCLLSKEFNPKLTNQPNSKILYLNSYISICPTVFTSYAYWCHVLRHSHSHPQFPPDVLGKTLQVQKSPMIQLKKKVKLCSWTNISRSYSHHMLPF